MKTEFEIVFPRIDRDSVVEKIRELWWICTKEKTLMKRTIFECPKVWDNGFVRVRDEWDKVTCTYKLINRENLDINAVQESETTVWDYKEMIQIFTNLWLKQLSVEESYREVWSIEWEIEFMIDTWPWLKTFIEIEWADETVVRKYTDILWFDYDDWIFWTVFEVYKEELWLSFEYLNWLPEITFENIPRK